MKKRILIVGVIVILFIILLVVSIVFNENDNNSEQNLFNIEDHITDEVVMTIKEGTLTSTSATLVITDLTDTDNIYGTWYRIDKLVGDKWQEMEILVDNLTETPMALHVKEDNILELETNWEKIYGLLETGQYRLYKDVIFENTVDSKYFYVEFTIK